MKTYGLVLTTHDLRKYLLDIPSTCYSFVYALFTLDYFSSQSILFFCDGPRLSSSHPILSADRDSSLMGCFEMHSSLQLQLLED